MTGLFEDSQLVADVRQTDLGSHVVVEMLKFAVVIYVADVATSKLAELAISRGLEPFASLGGVWLVAIGLLSFVALAYCALWERMRPRHLGVRFTPLKDTGLGLVVGYACGAVIMSVSVLIATLLGGFSLQGNLQNAAALNVLWMLAVYLFQAFGEEVLYRGAFMMAVARKNSVVVALVVSSLFFSLHHHFNAGYGPIAFVNLFILALLLGVTVLLTNRIWAATAIHAAWNFFQGNVFGVNVSGAATDQASTLLMSTATGNPLVTGGAMGIEGSLVSTVVLIAALVAVVLWARNRRS